MRVGEQLSENKLCAREMRFGASGNWDEWARILGFLSFGGIFGIYVFFAGNLGCLLRERLGKM